MRIIANNCEDAWKKAIIYLKEKGNKSRDSLGKPVLERLGMSMTIKSPSDFQVPLKLMKKKMDFIYPELEDLEAIAKGKITKNNFAKRLYDFDGVNQIEDFIIPQLKSSPATRRAITVNYDPRKDSINGSKAAVSVLSFFFKLEENTLNLVVFMRSLDCFLGLPANFVHSVTLQHYVAKQILAKPGTLTVLASSAHVYEDHLFLYERIENLK